MIKNYSTEGSRAIHVLKEIKQIEENDNLNKMVKFIIDEKDMTNFKAIIAPVDGLYQGLSFNFLFNVPFDYPMVGNPIVAKCLDNIYHPNIYTDGRLCLYYDWNGSMESGYKETLENLILGINYLFVHPANHGSDIPKNIKETMEKNISEYRKNDRKNDKKYAMKEYYGDVNQTLSNIKDWESYFPESCLKEHVRSRTYIITMSGNRKKMDILTLETVLSQIIRDPRYEFYVVGQLALIDDKYDMVDTMMPKNPNSITMSKIKRLVYPSDIKYNQIHELYDLNISLADFFNVKHKTERYDAFNRYIKILTNIEIVSNYEFKFVLRNDYGSTNKLKLDSKCNDERKYVIKIDQFMINTMNLTDYYLMLCDEPDPIVPVWIKNSYSLLNIGTNLNEKLKKVAFKLNPTDDNSQYVTCGECKDGVNEEDDDYNDNFHESSNCGLRLLTEDELKLINKDDIQMDLELTKKYVASTFDETGLDLSRVKNIR